MARYTSRRLSRQELETDQIALDAIRDLPDYTPLNQDCSLDRLNSLEAALREADQAERRALHALDVARDAAAAAAWALHEVVINAKTQVIAQYGPDSNAVQALGLKKKSERRRPRRTPTPTG